MTPSTAVTESTTTTTTTTTPSSVAETVALRPHKRQRVGESPRSSSSAPLSSSAGGGDQWKEYCYQLAFFKATHEHTNVPWDYVCEDDHKLNLPQWVLQQRCELLSTCWEAEMKNKKLPSSATGQAQGYWL
jgi:Helicase associated domain